MGVLIEACFDVQSDRSDAFYKTFLDRRTFGVKAELCRRALAALGDAVDQREVDALWKKVDHLVAVRNDLAHGSIHYPRDGSSALVFSDQDRGTISQPHDPDAISRQIVEVDQRLDAIGRTTAHLHRERTGLAAKYDRISKEPGRT